jgi:hypothetical protein
MNNKLSLYEQWGLDESEEPRLKQAMFYSKAKGMIPDRFVNSPASIYIGIKIAQRIDCDVLEVLNGLYVVHGTPGWSAEFLIARAKAKLGLMIMYETTGEGKTLQVRAKAIDKKGEVFLGTPVSMAMAEAEGWTRNSKYKSMPEYMLKKRAATFLIREQFPEVTAGFQTVDEVVDIVPQKAQNQVLTSATEIQNESDSLETLL